MSDLANEFRALISAGESAAVEFKSSLRYDYATGTVNKQLTKVVVKTVAGFMNAVGGTLVIGVSDTGSLLGLEGDLATLSKPNRDGYELALRTAIGLYAGVEISPRVVVQFADVDRKLLVRLICPAHDSPIFLRDGDRQEFYVRDGNSTRPLDVRAAHEYIRRRWPADPVSSEALQKAVEHAMDNRLKVLLDDALKARRVSFGRASPAEPAVPLSRPGAPNWVRMATRRTLDLFLSTLAGSGAWRRIYVISPWISEIEHTSSLTSEQIRRRLKDDDTTAYIVTRPPVEDWHHDAIQRLGKTGRANIVTVPGLHIKLYTAITQNDSFALLGSANFTQQSLLNREIGLLIDAFGEGRRLVSELNREAADIYRFPERRLLYQASFRPV